MAIGSLPVSTPVAAAVASASGFATLWGAVEGQVGPFFLVLGVFAFAGGVARLFYDTANADQSWRRQIGMVGLSIMAAMTTSMLLWDTLSARPLLLLGIGTGIAALGPTGMEVARSMLDRIISRER